MGHQIRFNSDDSFVIDNAPYRLSESSGDAVCFERLDGTGAPAICFTHSEVLELVKSERFQHERHGLSKGKAAVRSVVGDRDLSDFPPNVIAKALWRQRWCEAFDRRYKTGRLKKVDEPIKQHLPAMAAEVNAIDEAQQVHGSQAQAGKQLTFRKSPCPKSLMRWHSLYIASDRNPVVLALGSHKSGNRSHSICPDARALLCECVQGFLDANRPKGTKIVKDTRTAFRKENEVRHAHDEPELEVPSRAEIYREIKRLSPFVVCSAREGIEKARRDYAIYETGNDLQYPMERVEIDEWKVDILSVATRSGIWNTLSKEEKAAFPRTRRWLYVALDCATRCVVGLKVVSQPSSDEAIRVLDMITRDKTDFAKAAGAQTPWGQFGGLGDVVADNGSAFIDENFVMAASALGGCAFRPPAGLPHLRGAVERVFGTFITDLMPLLPGRTFSNPQERGEFEPHKGAVLTDDILTKVFVRYVVDIYHNSSHEGLGGDTPANRWEVLSKRYSVMCEPTPHARRSAFGERLERTLSGKGIRIEGLYYSCPEIHEAFLHSPIRRVSVRLDVMDIGTVSVEIDGKWYAAKSVLDGFGGVSMYAWKERRSELEAHYRDVVEITQDVVDAALSDISDICLDAYRIAHLSPPKTDFYKIKSAGNKQTIGLREETNFLDIDASDALLRNSIPVPKASKRDTHPEPPKADDGELQWWIEE